MTPSLLRSTAVLALLAMVTPWPTLVQASGQLPPTPLENRNFSSFDACLTFLKATWRTDQAKADSHPIPTEGGNRQTLISSTGIVVIDASHATYEVEEGWSFRRPDLENRQIRTDYSYQRRSYKCNGSTLTGTSTDGYALEGYEQMPSEPKP